MRTESMLKQKKLFAEYTLPVETSELEVQDIDNEDDWRMAEIKYRFLKTQK
jgi:N-acylneuraminate cytidylyltransferase